MSRHDRVSHLLMSSCSLLSRLVLSSAVCCALQTSRLLEIADSAWNGLNACFSFHCSDWWYTWWDL